MTPTLFYPVLIRTRGRVGLHMGAGCATAAAAKAVVKIAVDCGAASMGTVAREANGEREPLARYVYPPNACRIVEHWEAIWDATEKEPAK